MTLDLNAMPRTAFYSAPSRKWDDCSGEFWLLVLLPMKGKHDSGFALIDVVGVNAEAEVPLIRLSGCSDALSLNGGSYGDWPAGHQPRRDLPVEWHIDCLWRSKLFTLFTHKPITVGSALSSLYIYGGPK